MMEILRDSLEQRHDVEVRVINISGPSGGFLGNVRRTLESLCKTARLMRWADVVALHLSRSPVACLFVPVAYLFDKPLIFRQVGGADYHSYGGAFHQCLTRWVLRHADLSLLQTRRLAAMAREDAAYRAEWFPNHRPVLTADLNTAHSRTGCRRFAFVGLLDRAKGVAEIVAIDARLPEAVTIDLYGRLSNDFRESDFRGLRKIAYRGELAHALIPQMLREHDALLLPTSWVGEGYPGAILEAFGAGIPVIATDWLSIPEIVDDSCGLLIPPRDPDALAEAIRRLAGDASLYLRLCAGAAAKKGLFSSALWTDVFVSYCRQLTLGYHGTGARTRRQSDAPRGK